MSSSRDFAILGAILILAAVLRLIGLNWPLWYDELLTVDSHLRLPFSQMFSTYSMNHHYLFSLQAKGAVSLFGEAAWAVRLPAYLFGLGAIAATWVLARDVFRPQNTRPWIAHLTALLLALSYHHIWFSQNARGYTELAFFATLGMILWLRGINRPRPGLWVLYGMVLAAGVFTHLTGAFFFAAQGLFWAGLVLGDLIRGQRDRIVWPAVGYLLGGALTLLLYAPLMASLLVEMGGVAEGSAVDLMQEYQSPIWTVIEAVRTAIGNTGPLVGIMAVAVLVTVGFGAVALHPHTPYFAPMVILHIVLTMALLGFLGMRIWPRFFFTDIGFLMLLIVAGVFWACRVAGHIIPVLRSWLFPLAAIAMIVLSAGLATRNYTAPKQDMVGAYQLVSDKASTDARVLSAGVGSIVFNSYFDARWTEVMDDTAYRAALAQPGPVWIVAAFPARTFRMIPALEADAATGDVTLIRAFDGSLGDGAVLVYHRP